MGLLIGSGGAQVELGTNPLWRDAWGKPKFALDSSIHHGMFTYNVPITKWYETRNNVAQTDFVRSTSVNGKLNVTSGTTSGDETYLRTYRNPRYQPNRGMLYSGSQFVPNPTATGEREWGTFTAESGVSFSVIDGVAYANVRTTINGTPTIDNQAIDLSVIGLTIADLAFGHLYDVQYQWRGVGGYAFYIDLKLVKFIPYLGIRTELTMFNPANPFGFRCKNTNGTEVVLESGCVNVDSEGGDRNGGTYGSVGTSTDSGQVAISGFNVPILAIRSKPIAPNGRINTRDTLALLASAWSDQRSMFRVWQTREFNRITENQQSWQDYGDGHLEYIEYDNPNVTTPMSFDRVGIKPVFGCRVDQDNTYSTSALFEGRTDIFMTPGDMLVFTGHRETGTGCNFGVTFEFSEEI